MPVGPSPDIAVIPIGSHCNSTLVAYDVLDEPTSNGIDRVRVLVTAGSPLHKYDDLFTWGTDMGNIQLIAAMCQYERWLSFYDPNVVARA